MRTPIQITFSVWRALFLREALFRLFGDRGAWFWLLLEPMIQIIVLMFIFAAVRLHQVGGVGSSIWIMVGMLAFLMFRRTGTQAMNAIASNRALFSYRQVKPVDTVIVRTLVEGFLMCLVVFLLMSGAALVGLDVLPSDPLEVMTAFFGLWLLGVGYGLILSVAKELVVELGNIANLLLTPLYFISGVIIPLQSIPEPYRHWLAFNPILHGVEGARLGFSPFYRVPQALDVGYLYAFASVLIFLGLLLHLHFAQELAAE